MPYEVLILQRDGAVAKITLNRPDKLNALNTALRDEVRAALEEIEADDGISVAVITGAGSTCCAGFDTSEFATTSPEEIFSGASSRQYHYRLQHFAKPLVAAIHGPAMGGGMDIAVLADVRIATAAAVFGHPEIKFGAATLFGPLAAVVGGGIARELCLTGRRVDAEEAMRIGLVNKVVPERQLMEEALSIANGMAEAPAAALQQTKASIVAAAPFRFPA